MGADVEGSPSIARAVPVKGWADAPPEGWMVSAIRRATLRILWACEPSVTHFGPVTLRGDRTVSEIPM
jgi:hypothetical protein